MNKEQATQFYLEDVLGIQSFIRPHSVGRSESLASETSAPKPSTLQAVASDPAGVCENIIGSKPVLVLWVPTRPTTAENTLMAKMMSAAKLKSYIVFWGNDLQQLSAVGRESCKAVLMFFGSSPQPIVTEDSFFTLRSVGLNSMLEGSASEIQAHKKRAWDNIKGVLSFLTSSGGL